MSTVNNKILKLKSSNGVVFEVDEEAAVQSRMIKNMVDEDCADGEIPIMEVDDKTLKMIMEYWKKHADKTVTDEEMEQWDDEFVNKDPEILYHLVMAANYLDVEKLVVLICQKVANMIRGKQPEQIRQLLHIKNDFDPEEEERIRKQNSWAFE